MLAESVLRTFVSEICSLATIATRVTLPTKPSVVPIAPEIASDWGTVLTSTISAVILTLAAMLCLATTTGKSPVPLLVELPSSLALVR